MCPAFYYPAGRMEQVGGGLSDVTAPSDQNSRHDVVAASLCRGAPRSLQPARRHSAVATTATGVAVASRCCGRDFDFFKDLFLNGTDLFETNQLEERKKSYHHLYARCGGPEQIGKTNGTSRHTPQNRVDLFRNAKTFAENLLHVLSRFYLFDHRLERVDQLKDSNFSQTKRFLRSWRWASFSCENALLFEFALMQFLRSLLEFFVLDQLPD